MDMIVAIRKGGLKVSDAAGVAVSTSLVLFDDFRNELRTIDFLDCNIVDTPGWTAAAF